MFTRKLLGIHKSRLIRLRPYHSLSYNDRWSKFFTKNHSIVSSCSYSSVGSTKKLSFAGSKRSWENRHNQDSNHKKFDFRVGAFFSALIIFLLGIQQVGCDPYVQGDAPVQKDTTSSKPSNDDSKDKESESLESTKSESKQRRKDKASKAPPDLPNKTKPDDNLDSKNLPSLPPNKYKEPMLSNSALSLKSAIDMSAALLNYKVIESGSPGLSIAVSVNGNFVWSSGIGLADVENNTRMSSYSVMRIASISKPLTMVAVCQLIEEGKLDIDAPIQQYVPSFPKKFVDGEEVTITTRHLLNHTSGIRHYELKSVKEKKDKERKRKKEREEEVLEEEEEEVSQKGDGPKEDEDPVSAEIKKKRKKTADLLFRISKPEPKEEESEFELEEYYIKDHFRSTKQSLKLFQDDELLFKPGEGYYYTTHGYTLVSAVVEGASGKKFPDLMVKLFRDLGMKRTTLDRNTPIIPRRARMYVRDTRGRLKNAPYVDNSYKWAGGGFLSNVVDLNNFGNAMLYSYQNVEDKEPKGFLKASTMRNIWKISPKTKKNSDQDSGYGLGWVVTEEEKHPKAFAHKKRFCASHTGGAIGASSVLLIMPDCTEHDDKEGKEHNYEEMEVNDESSAHTPLPHGVVVAIIVNQQEVGLHKTALEIAKIFERVQRDRNVLGAIGGKTKHKIYSLSES